MKVYIDTRDLVIDLDGNTVPVNSQKPDAMKKLRDAIKAAKLRGATNEELANIHQDEEDLTYGEALKRALNRPNGEEKDKRHMDGGKMFRCGKLADKIKAAENDTAGDGIVALDKEEVALCEECVEAFWASPSLVSRLWAVLQGEGNQPRAKEKLAAELSKKE